MVIIKIFWIFLLAVLGYSILPCSLFGKSFFDYFFHCWEADKLLKDHTKQMWSTGRPFILPFKSIISHAPPRYQQLWQTKCYNPTKMSVISILAYFSIFLIRPDNQNTQERAWNMLHARNLLSNNKIIVFNV